MPEKISQIRLSQSPLLSERNVAPILNVTVRCLQRWRVTGEGPSFCKLGALVRYRQEDIEDFIQANLRCSTSEG